jgi:hypothetical protein
MQKHSADLAGRFDRLQAGRGALDGLHEASGCSSR